MWDGGAFICSSLGQEYANTRRDGRLIIVSSSFSFLIDDSSAIGTFSGPFSR